MARVVRSPRARHDITEVLRYTRNRWGKGQARDYRDLIAAALKAIAADPSCGKYRGTRPGILGHHIQQPGRAARHIVFCTRGLDWSQRRGSNAQIQQGLLLGRRRS
jgi:plasmid stabilization system protein ParE